MQSENLAFTNDMLRRFAKSVGVKLSEARLERIAPRVERYLEEVNRLQDMDVSEVEPAVTFSMKLE